MELHGSVTLAGAPAAVWQALNDPEVLRRCIPGCEEVRQISPTELHVRVMLKLGPVRANFVGKVLQTDVRPLQGCTLNFEGSGGAAGFAQGSSRVTLTAVPGGTQLDYTAQAAVAGKLGQIGGRLMDASAKQMADKFFTAFAAQMAGTGSGAAAAPLPVLAGAPGSASAQGQTSAQFPIAAYAGAAADAGAAQSAAATPAWFALEKPRLLWFFAGVGATSIGVWMGAHWLR